MKLKNKHVSHPNAVVCNNLLHSVASQNNIEYFFADIVEVYRCKRPFIKFVTQGEGILRH
jgi:hypothetical protein